MILTAGVVGNWSRKPKINRPRSRPRMDVALSDVIAALALAVSVIGLAMGTANYLRQEAADKRQARYDGQIRQMSQTMATSQSYLALAAIVSTTYTILDKEGLLPEVRDLLKTAAQEISQAAAPQRPSSATPNEQPT